MSSRAILDKINSPDDVKALPDDKLSPLCSEIRSFLVGNVTKTGGHLASNLGVVELTVSLIRAMNFPYDRVIWDVGHQSYVYKMLTDRKDRFDSLRSPGGLSGFEKRCESKYDSFGTGHSSTAISAAIGFAQADRLANRSSTTVAVVGDGAFTGGLVHEALNNIREDLKLIIILNENEMSISKNIGGFARSIAKIRATRGYYNTKKATRVFISSIPLVGKSAFKAFRKMKQRVKNSMYKSTYFEDLGLYYLGPADGNDCEQVETLFREARSYGKATVIHLKTQKGKGYLPAEKNPGKYHSLKPVGSKSFVGFPEKMGDLLVKKAEKDKRICAVTAAMADGCGLARFKNKYPDRFFDVGIAEGHALTFSAGLSAGGMKPVVCIYSTFLQRAYDNIIHDVALQDLPLTVMVDRASLAVGDGPTHHGIFDVSFLSAIPNTAVYAPCDFSSLDRIMSLSLSGGVNFIRYPNSAEFSYPEILNRKVGFLRHNIDTKKIDVYIITYGKIVSSAVSAYNTLKAEGIKAGIILLEKLKPFDTADILSLIFGKAPMIFLEEGVKSGGAGENLYEAIRLSKNMQNRDYRILAIDSSFADCKTKTPLYEFCHISDKDVVCLARELINK